MNKHWKSANRAWGFNASANGHHSFEHRLRYRVPRALRRSPALLRTIAGHSPRGFGTEASLDGKIDYVPVVVDAATGDWQQAKTNLDEARHIVRSHIARVLPGLSPKEQALFLAENDEQHFHDALSLGLLRRGDDADVAELSFGWLVNGKAVVQEAIAQHTILARQSGDPQTIAAVQQLQDIRSQLASLTYRGEGR